MKTALIAAVLIASTIAAEAEPNGLLRRWQTLNVQCRGGSGDDPSTQRACRQRASVQRKLEAQGCRLNGSGSWLC